MYNNIEAKLKCSVWTNARICKMSSLVAGAIGDPYELVTPFDEYASPPKLDKAPFSLLKTSLAAFPAQLLPSQSLTVWL